MQYGTSRPRVLRFPPARLSLMIRKSSIETWVNCGLPAHSPIAQDLAGGVPRPLINEIEPGPANPAPRLIEPDPGGVWNASRRDQDVAALDLLLTGGRAHGNADFLAGSALHIESLGRH